MTTLRSFQAEIEHFSHERQKQAIQQAREAHFAAEAAKHKHHKHEVKEVKEVKELKEVKEPKVQEDHEHDDESVRIEVNAQREVVADDSRSWSTVTTTRSRLTSRQLCSADTARSCSHSAPTLRKVAGRRARPSRQHSSTRRSLAFAPPLTP